MYTREEFGSTETKEQFQELKGQYKFKEGSTYSEVQPIIEDIQLKMNRSIPYQHQNVRIYHTDGVNGKLESISISLAPKASAGLENLTVENKSTIFAGESFYDKFIEEVAAHVDEFIDCKKIFYNLKELNEMFEVIRIPNKKFNISFGLGEGILDVSDKHIMIGISQEAIMNLSSNGLFHEDPTVVDFSIERVKELIKSCKYPYNIFGVSRNSFSHSLGFYTKESPCTLMKKFARRKIEKVRVGLGYGEQDGVFVLIEKKAVSDEELKQYKKLQKLIEEEKVYIDTLDTKSNSKVKGFGGKERNRKFSVAIIDNQNPSKEEKKDNKNKILIKYKVSPYQESINARVAKSITDFII